VHQFVPLMLNDVSTQCLQRIYTNRICWHWADAWNGAIPREPQGKCATLFWTITHMFWSVFLHLLYQWKQEWNEYSTEELQNLQLYSNCVFTLPDKKLKPHKTAHFEVYCHCILLLNSKSDSVS